MRTVDDVPFALTIPAPAKLNLGLEVVGRRADGYHDLATIFLTVSLFDEISVASESGTSIGLECSGSNLPPQENLVWRAAEAMQEAAPGRGALLKLEKRIPVAAGLGGASSDAAATLLALRELWQAPVTDEALAAMALELGSDVPFLLRGGCALGGGRGEELLGLPLPGERPTASPGEPSPPAPLPVRGRGETDWDRLGLGEDRYAGTTSEAHSDFAAASPSPAHRERGWGEGYFLIVAPRIEIPRKTASLFAALEAGDFSNGARVRRQAERLRAGLPLDPELLGNAFSRALYALRPDVESVALAMHEAGAEHVALSGAGPAHYALFDDMATAQLAKRRLEDRLRDTAEVFLTVRVPARETDQLRALPGQP